MIFQGQRQPLHCRGWGGAVWAVAGLESVSGPDPGLLHLQQPAPGGGGGGRGWGLCGQDSRVLGLRLTYNFVPNMGCDLSSIGKL